MRVTLMIAQDVARVIARSIVTTTNSCMPSCDHESALASMRVLLQAWEWWCNTLVRCKLIQIYRTTKSVFWACTKHTFDRTNMGKMFDTLRQLMRTQESGSCDHEIFPVAYGRIYLCTASLVVFTKWKLHQALSPAACHWCLPILWLVCPPPFLESSWPVQGVLNS